MLGVNIMNGRKIGLIVNPIAGVGGKVGLKGSDGVVEEAMALGSVPMSEQHAFRAVQEFANRLDVIFVAGGSMGEEIVLSAGLNCEVVYHPISEKTAAEDTVEAAKAMIEVGIELLLFAGGDGTARNIAKEVGSQVPLLGIPAGVKMYSGVFALTSTHAGLLVKKFLDSTTSKFREVEILDIDEDYLRRGRPDTQLYGYAQTFSDPTIQVTKSSQKQDEGVMLDAVCRRLAKDFEHNTIYIIGPGSTMQSLKKYAGEEGTLLGVDVIQNGKILILDAQEKQILALLKDFYAKIYVGVIGGTGCLFGRGNQQISANVIELVGKENIHVISTVEKLNGLGYEGFFVDTGKQAVDKMLSGFIHVDVGVGRQMMMPVQGE